MHFLNVQLFLLRYVRQHSVNCLFIQTFLFYCVYDILLLRKEVCMGRHLDCLHLHFLFAWVCLSDWMFNYILQVVFKCFFFLLFRNHVLELYKFYLIRLSNSLILNHS